MRLDQWLFEKGFFDSREKCRREIVLGRIREAKSGKVLDKPGWAVPKNLEVSIQEQSRFVGRGGEKLAGFLEIAGLNVEGDDWLDVGSSTGGFTDCLLQLGAKSVVAIDVGTHQLHEKLRADSRVELHENSDIRNFDFSLLKRKPRGVVVDVSFISLRKILPGLFSALPNSLYILLFKPQFELGREIPKKRGVVSSESARKQGLEEMAQFLRTLGFGVVKAQDSAVKGMKGNQETFMMVQKEQPISHVFRTYDIRGHAEQDLSEDLYFRLGLVLGEKISSQKKNGKVGIGRDGRLSSPKFHAALMRGLSHYPLQLIDYGLTTTPMIYFASHSEKLDGAFQITASHNPGQDNGLKMMVGGETLFGDEILNIGHRANEISPPTAKLAKTENRSEFLHEAYLKFLRDSFPGLKKFKVVVDCGNGMAGLLAKDVYAPVSSSLQMLYEEVDGNFPNHPADPTQPENLTDLIAEIKKQKADVGLAFDGDADRLGVVTASGRILYGDEILMLLSEKLLSEKPGSTIIAEVKCSEKLFQMIADRGGKPVMYRTGHSLIKKRMKELKAPMAGEMSGHLFFADRYFGFDDAVYAGLRVLEAMSNLKMSLDEWIEQFPESHITPEIRIDCREDEKASLVESVKKHFSARPHREMILIDGMRVSFADGSWILVRASNTQAVLVLRIEASSQARLKELKDETLNAMGRIRV